MEVYCVKEKRFTPNVPGSEKNTTTKNGRRLLKVKCASCGITKTRFVSNKTQSGGNYDMRIYAGNRVDDPTNPLYQRGGAFDLHKAIGKLPKPKKGWTLPGHNYTGPYNPLEKQLSYDPKTGKILKIYQQPTGATDAVSMQHDVDYAVCAGKKNEKGCKHAADKKMVKALMTLFPKTNGNGVMPRRATQSARSKKWVWVLVKRSIKISAKRFQAFNQLKMWLLQSWLSQVVIRICLKSIGVVPSQKVPSTRKPVCSAKSFGHTLKIQLGHVIRLYIKMENGITNIATKIFLTHI